MNISRDLEESRKQKIRIMFKTNYSETSIDTDAYHLYSDNQEQELHCTIIYRLEFSSVYVQNKTHILQSKLRFVNIIKNKIYSIVLLHETVAQLSIDIITPGLWYYSAYGG